MVSPWAGMVNIIIHGVHSRELDDSLADAVAKDLLRRPIGTKTQEEQYQILADGIRQGYPVPTTLPTTHSAEDMGAFVAEVVQRMDDARPWPVLPYLLLPREAVVDFLRSGHPVARIHASFHAVSNALRRIFYHDKEYGVYLPLRLRSGAAVLLVADYWENSSDVLLITTNETVPAHEIVRELVDGSELDRKQIRLVISPEEIEYENIVYDTTPLQPEFQGEHILGNPVWGSTAVDYLTTEKAASYRLFANHGVVYRNNDHTQPFDTTHARTLWTPDGGRAIFVMDADGHLYSSPEHVLGRFHHSSFLAGQPVAGAGEIQVVQGRVQLLSDHSTHYRPARRFTRQVVDSLRRQGIPFDDRAIEYHYPE